jgi:hypothetical protein
LISIFNFSFKFDDNQVLEHSNIRIMKVIKFKRFISLKFLEKNHEPTKLNSDHIRMHTIPLLFRDCFTLNTFFVQIKLGYVYFLRSTKWKNSTFNNHNSWIYWYNLKNELIKHSYSIEFVLEIQQLKIFLSQLNK